MPDIWPACRQGEPAGVKTHHRNSDRRRCSVVGGEDDDRVVVDAHILELLHRRQEFVFIAKMVLAKLCGVSAGRLTSCSSLVLPNRIVTHDMILSWQCT